MFNTLLHFAIFAYQFKLGPCIVNRPCTVNAVLGCSLSRLCPVHARYHFRKENCVKKQLKL